MFEDLNITPIWNVPYHFRYNDACEKYWAQLKAHFRPLLLKKMLSKPHSKEPLLKDSVRETILNVSTSSIPKFVLEGLNALRQDANLVRNMRGIPLLPMWSQELLDRFKPNQNQ